MHFIKIRMKGVIRQCIKQDNNWPGMSEANIMNMYFLFY